jgi:hypothetical protein
MCVDAIARRIALSILSCVIFRAHAGVFPNCAGSIKMNYGERKPHLSGFISTDLIHQKLAYSRYQSVASKETGIDERGVYRVVNTTRYPIVASVSAIDGRVSMWTFLACVSDASRGERGSPHAANKKCYGNDDSPFFSFEYCPSGTDCITLESRCDDVHISADRAGLHCDPRETDPGFYIFKWVGRDGEVRAKWTADNFAAIPSANHFRVVDLVGCSTIGPDHERGATLNDYIDAGRKIRGKANQDTYGGYRPRFLRLSFVGITQRGRFYDGLHQALYSETLDLDVSDDALQWFHFLGKRCLERLPSYKVKRQWWWP